MASVLIVNPRASKVSDEVVAGVVRALPAGVVVVRTGGAGDATALAREHEPSAEAIYVLGGDGTYNEVVNGVSGHVPLGFLPGGGTSVLPRALGLGRDPVAAAVLLARGVERRIGLGRVDGRRRFTFSAGIGLDAELVRRIDARGRDADGARPGDAAFVAEAVRLLLARRGRFPEALEIEGVGRAAFLLVANCDPYTYAGPLALRVAAGASFDAGLALVAPDAVRPRALPRLLVELTRGAAPRPGLTVVRDLERIVVRCDRPLPLQVDGEDLGDVERVAFASEPAAVTALVPRGR